MRDWLWRLYPAWFRERYGDELADLLARSDHRARDVVDVAVHAGQLRWEHLMIRPLRLFANIAVVVTVFVFGYTLNDLEGGIAEIPRHWWSSAALGLTMLSIVARAAIDLAGGGRHRQPPHFDAP